LTTNPSRGTIKKESASRESAAEAAARDLSHCDLDDRKQRPAALHRYVSQDALDKVRTAAPGWDRQYLLAAFLKWPGSQTARDMDAAFIGWARKFTKGKRPS